jgi:hypothetical protein
VWPGNVRELRNVMRRAVALSNGIVITPRDLPVEKLTAPFVADRSDRQGSVPQLFDEVRREREAIERQRIVDALDRSAGNQTEAARLLGISRRTLINRLEAYGLPRPRKGRRSAPAACRQRRPARGRSTPRWPATPARHDGSRVRGARRPGRLRTGLRASRGCP